jgi:hypothetical protein
MSRTLFSLAGFQVIISGRFWVIAEAVVHAETHGTIPKAWGTFKGSPTLGQLIFEDSTGTIRFTGFDGEVLATITRN